MKSCLGSRPSARNDAELPGGASDSETDMELKKAGVQVNITSAAMGSLKVYFISLRSTATFWWQQCRC